MKGAASTIKCINSSIMYSQNGNVDFVKALDHNTAFSWWQKNGENAFNCILHDLLVAKFAAYGFDYQFLWIIESFLSSRQQRTNINNTFRRYSEIFYRVPQDSILGPLLFNIYICDIFFDIVKCDIGSFSGYNFDFSLDNAISNLEKSTNPLLN